MFVEYSLNIGYKKLIHNKEVDLISKTQSNKEEDVEKNSSCKNCPYFIYRIPCPYHRGETTRLHNLMSQNPSKRARRK